MPVPVEYCIHELFEAQAVRTPDAPAVVFEGVAVSYADLNARANRLAHHLIDLGLGPDDRVAIGLERGVEMVVAILATLKSGGAYVPLDPGYPAERLAFMIRDSAARVLLTQRSLSPVLGVLPDAPPALALDSNPPPWASLPEANPKPAALGLTVSNLAYVIYTSGSTGAPKGVMVEHRSLVSSTTARIRYYKKYERLLLLSSISFDSSVAGIFGALLSGGCLYIPRAAAPLDPQELVRQIHRCAITSLLCVPSLLNMLLDNRIRDASASLRQIIVGGDNCPPALVDRVASLLPAATFYNEYGPTENTVWATVHACAPGRNGAIVPIGRAIENTRIYILDPDGERVPAGAIGELYIGGAGVARGYLNRPELTAERFLADRFAPAPAAADASPSRLYRTGDRGRQLTDGTIEFLGRIDNQVKIRGFRIELGEIEAALLTYPGVREAVVLAREDGLGEKRLVAYFTSAGNEIAAAALRADLARRLPQYMVPVAFERLRSLPLTPHGKLDREALQSAPLHTAAVAGRPPRCPDEALLCRLFARITRHPAVDANSDFAAIGGDSLGAMVLVTELRQLGIDLPLATLFEARTPAAIAAALASQRAAAATARPTLFLIPGSGGDEPALAALRADWAGLIDCVLLDYTDWPQLISADFGVDDLVADMIRRIAERAPSGPLLVAGYSLGGFVAWAVAKRLARTARSVDVLLILDTDARESAPGAETGQSRPPGKAQRLSQRILHRLHAFATVHGARDGAEGDRMLGEFIAYRILERPRLLRLLARFRPLRLPPGLRYWLGQTLRWNLHIRMVHSSRAAKYAAAGRLEGVSAILFQTDRQESPNAAGLGWQAWCAALRVEEIAGDHTSMLNARGPNSLYERLPAILAALAQGGGRVAR